MRPARHLEIMKKPLQKLEKPFNSRIFRVYLEYLRDRLNWSELEIDKFLESFGASQREISRDTSWYSIEFADRFYNSLLEATNIPDIAYQAGKFLHEKKTSPIIHSLMKSFASVSTVYRVLARIAPHFSKAATLKTSKWGWNSIKVEAIPVDHVNQRPYICENRRGMFESLPVIFGLPPAKVIEKQCIHKGAESCSYSIRWAAIAGYWTYIGLAVISILIGAGIWLVEPVLGYVGSGFFFLTGVIFALYQKMKAQTHDLLSQNENLDQTVSELEHRSQQMSLLGEITKITSLSSDSEELQAVVVRKVCQILGYDRAILLRVDPERHVLTTKAFFGFDELLKDVIEEAEFTIRNDNYSGFFIQVVNSKSPLLIENVKAQLDKLSPRSQRFVQILRSTSFVAVPFLDQNNNVLGVLAVDYVTEGKALNFSDQELLQALAEHLSIGLARSEMIKSLKENLELTRRFSLEQEQLRGVFQKFVPTDLVFSLSTETSSKAIKKKLSNVRKKEISILFQDIYNFSQLSQKLSAEEVIELLNLFFSKIEPIIRSHHGMVDKFLGDGLMAVFEGPSSAKWAARASNEIIKCVPTINSELSNMGCPPIEIGLGLNYGPTILGHVGSPDRMNFTALGESVNMAARLEAFTRELGPNKIACSASFRYQAGDEYEWIDHGGNLLKGYSEPVQIFELSVASTADKIISITDRVKSQK